ncbi:MAG: hypothetical protein LBT26_00700 [Clostridiales Family XIII bacterium]|jgi:hypothetical protein|nr:hypothetical protein [Clostridiales Family XIII bacterium]
MRKHQQAKILELLRTLGEAHGELRKQSAPEAAVNLLAGCQEFARRIGEFIEETEGEGTQAVTLLEEYCELLYYASVGTGGANHTKKLQAQLAKIENTVRSELVPDRIEAAFLSYSASMSDSILSIYLAAKADPDCDAYWIPIPYYERNAGGSFGTMHLDGAECYGGVECTDWQKYDLEARRPDAVFTFAPYDAGNFVTSVHPDFYCERLRGLTDLLCYVPYFVTADDVEEQFCTVAGCVFAHKVILQSEKIRSTYIREFKAAYGKSFGKPEEKFVALGSPKYDAVINTKRGDCRLPDEWRVRAGGKKVIFYNTTIAAILQGNEQYLEKLRHVLDTFRKREDVVLWWRPHPLNEATYKSMRAQLSDGYRKIIADYKRGGFGIFDDTADFHRAIAVSDGYYGDGSSAVALYEATGKPLMIQNLDVTEKADDAQKDEYLHSDVVNFGQRLLTVDAFRREYPEWHEYWLPLRNEGQAKHVLVPDYEYGTSSFLNAVYKLDAEKGRAEYFKSFPANDVSGWMRHDAWLYHAPVRRGDTFLFVPCRARRWAFYDLAADEWTFRAVPEELHPSKEWRAAFGGWIVYDDEIIVFPGESGAFAKCNVVTHEITYHRDWIAKLPKAVENADWGVVCTVLFYRGSLLVVSQQTNRIVEINPETMTVIRSYAVGNDPCGFRSALLVPDTDAVYLIKFREPGKEPWTEAIVKWDIKTKSIAELKDLPVNFAPKHTQNACSGLLYWRNKLYATPLQGDSILKIDLETDEVTRVAVTPDFDFFERKSEFYNGWAKDMALPYLVFNGKCMKFTAQLPYDYALADIDLETGEISNRRKWHVTGVEDLYRQKSRTSARELWENPYYPLDDFLDDLAAGRPTRITEEADDKPDEQNVNTDGTSGKAIYAYIKKAVMV